MTRCLEYVPDELKPAVGPVLETIADLTRRIRGLDHTIDQLCQERYPETRLLQQVPGVGALSALAYVLVLEDGRLHKVPWPLEAVLQICSVPSERIPTCTRRSAARSECEWKRRGRARVPRTGATSP